MPSQPPPGSTGGSPRIPAPFHLAPDSTSMSPRTPALGSTGGFPRIPAALSAQSTGGIIRIPASLSGQSTGWIPRIPHVSQKRTVLVDWWLEKVEGEEGKVRVAGTTHTPQMRNGAFSSRGKRNLAVRVFRSSAIVKCHDDFYTIESEDGFHIQLGSLLNTSKTLENGFSKEVCQCFEFGFPSEWQDLVTPKMVHDTPSEATTSETRVGSYMKKFLSDDFASSIRYDSPEFELYLPDDNAGSITASWGLNDLRMGVPEKPLAPPGEACNNSQENDQHESMQIDACKQELVNRSFTSFSPNSKVDGNILAPSKIMSVVDESYRSTVGCGQAEEDADIQQESMRSYSSEHGMVTLPIDFTSSQLGEPGIPKSGNDSVILGTTDALELPSEGMTPKFGVIGGSEDTTGRRLRSGKVFGMQSGGPIKRRYKRKKIQPEASSKQMVDQGATLTVDLTSHENDDKDQQRGRQRGRGRLS